MTEADATQAPFWCPVCEWTGYELKPNTHPKTGTVIFRCPGCGCAGVLQKRKDVEAPPAAAAPPPNAHQRPGIGHRDTNEPMTPDAKSITPLGFLDGKISVALGIVRPDKLWFFMFEEKLCFDLAGAKDFLKVLQAKISEIEGAS